MYSKSLDELTKLAEADEANPISLPDDYWEIILAVKDIDDSIEGLKSLVNYIQYKDKQTDMIKTINMIARAADKIDTAIQSGKAIKERDVMKDPYAVEDTQSEETPV